ncbi:MAG: hypothetical protein OXG69_14300, partial [bacterium]|nr:hypothetical protein [bacterium]
PAEMPHAHQKYWLELLGLVGGRVRPPLLELTDAERAATREAFEGCGLQAGGPDRGPSTSSPRTGSPRTGSPNTDRGST